MSNEVVQQSKIREIQAIQVTQAIIHLCQQANFSLGKDVLAAIQKAQAEEKSPLGRDILGQLLENAALADREQLPLCQDCGVTVVFLEIGQNVHINGGDLHSAVQEGVRQGYAKTYLRKSMVAKPFSDRINTTDNTPAIIHTEIVPGDRLKITIMCKGAGSENMSRFAILKPSEGRQGVVDFVVKAVDEAGANPCPPLVVGVGIGGTAEMAMLLAKKSLIRPVGSPNLDPEVAGLEQEILERVNALGVGTQGLGGSITALAVHAEAMPAHIGSLPVAVNLQCHSHRHREAII
ncbi:MAG: fumarate hydratase [Chloroflexi bacterium]|nr:fumarate hydratase [Chloroflexota bacterium]